MGTGRWLHRLAALLGRHRSQEQIDAAAVERLRARGVSIGERCRIYATEFSSEPFLVTLGDDVHIAGGVQFLTHDGAARLLSGTRPQIQRLGRIRVGDRCFIGQKAIILPGTGIGAGSIVGAGAVVGGEIAANSLVVGNPARVIGRASLCLKRLERHPDAVDSYGLPPNERRAFIEQHFARRRTEEED